MIILDFLLLLFLSFIFHDFGHYLYYESRGIKTKFKWNKRGLGLYVDDNLKLDDQTIINGIFSGIFLGLLPFFFYLHLPNYWIFSAFLLYIYGCFDDFKILRRLNNGNNKGV